MAINFSSSNFPSLIEKEDWQGVWNSVGKDDLPQAELDILYDFARLVGPPYEGELNPAKLLLAKCSEVKDANGKVVDRVLDQLYGPAIYRNEHGQVVLKFADAFWAIHEDQNALIIGPNAAKAHLEFADKPAEIQIKDGKGAFTKVKIQSCRVSWSFGDHIFEIPVKFDYKQNAIKDAIIPHLNKGNSLAYYLAMPPSGEGGGGILPMKELGEGRFAIAAFIDKPTPNGDNASSWVIQLEDGRQCWARGNAQKQLEAGVQYRQGMSLIVANLRQVKDKCYLDCAIRGVAAVGPALAAPAVTANLPW